MSQTENTENPVDIEIGTNLIEKRNWCDNLHLTTIKFKFTCIDFYLFTLIGIGVLLAGVCSSAERCGGHTEIGVAGYFTILVGCLPYAVMIILSLFDLCITSFKKAIK